MLAALRLRAEAPGMAARQGLGAGRGGCQAAARPDCWPAAADGWCPVRVAAAVAGYGVQALSTGEGVLGSLAKFGESFNAAN
jgi:hypothetical protein